jgi:hypothetical protein
LIERLEQAVRRNNAYRNIGYAIFDALYGGLGGVGFVLVGIGDILGGVASAASAAGDDCADGGKDGKGGGLNCKAKQWMDRASGVGLFITSGVLLGVGDELLAAAFFNILAKGRLELQQAQEELAVLLLKDEVGGASSSSSSSSGVDPLTSRLPTAVAGLGIPPMIFNSFGLTTYEPLTYESRVMGARSTSSFSSFSAAAVAPVQTVPSASSASLTALAQTNPHALLAGCWRRLDTGRTGQTTTRAAAAAAAPAPAAPAAATTPAAPSDVSASVSLFVTPHTMLRSVRCSSRGA